MILTVILTPKEQQGLLHNKLVWLTRPLGQNAVLQSALENLGARVFCLPLLEIIPLLPTGANRTRLQNLDQYDLVFYVSSNAANAGMAAINNWWPQYPAHILNFAVGPGTAAVIEQHGLLVHYPTQRMDSEAMLALPQLQSIAGKKALIVRGVGGREILSAGLLERGASVDYAELYERKAPHYALDYLQECVHQHSPDALVVSSSEAMDNLKTLFSNWYEPWPTLPLYVASQRLADHARAAGFQNMQVMAGATDATIIEGLCKLAGDQQA